MPEAISTDSVFSTNDIEDCQLELYNSEKNHQTWDKRKFGEAKLKVGGAAAHAAVI